MYRNNQTLENKLSIQEIRKLNEFWKLKSSWNILANCQPPCTPFLSHEWFQIWTDHFLKDNELLILVLYQNRDPVAIAPFMIVNEKYKVINVRKVELIGNVYSPLRSFILGNISAEKKEKYISKIFNHLFKEFTLWDLVDISGYTSEEEDLKIIEKIIKNHKSSLIKRESFVNWYLTNINYTGDDYLSMRSKSLQQEIRRRRRRLQETGIVDFKVIKENIDIKKYVRDYYEVYKKSWKRREGVGPNFHKDLAKIAAQRGWLRLGFITLNKIPIATQFRIVHDRTCFFLKTAYDSAYAKYGPGTIMSSEMIKYLIDIDNVKEINFGPGNESYKSSWANEKRHIKGVLIFNRTIKGKLLSSLFNRIIPIFNRYEILRKLKLIVNKQIPESN